MIKESFLPVGLLETEAKELLSEDRPERPDPLSKFNSRRRNNDKQMNVIGHDHVAAHSDVMFFGTSRESMKNFVNFLPREQQAALVGIERHEVKRMNRAKQWD